MKINAREIIFNILYEVDEKGAFSNVSINRNLEDTIEKKDESFVREIVYGVLENRLYLDYIIKDFSKIRFNKISVKVRNILRMGIYQIIFMDKVPDSAACNEAVNLAKKITHKGTHGFINGILRSVIRNRNDIKLPDKNKTPIDYLSVKYSNPMWLTKRWVDGFGYEFTESLLEYNNKKPLLNIRVNTLKVTRDELVLLLKNKDLNVEKTIYSDDGIVIYNPFRITETEEFKKGYFTIQDESSMLVGDIMNPVEGSLVIDLCSAPGGKCTHLAQKMKNKGKIISRDIYDHKIKLIDQNAKRLGINIIETQKFDASILDESLLEKADYCLVDAPCSGFGIIRRKPEIKWTKNEDDLNKINDIQYKILLNASRYIKKKGTLIYSTCTIEKNENINIIKKFLKHNKDFELSSINNTKLPNSENGYIELYPNIHNTDGFFIAKLIKK